MNVQLKQMTDVESLLHWRAEVLEHVFGNKPDASLLTANRRYYGKHLFDGSHVAYVVECDGKECGCGGICFTDELPSPDNPSGRCGYLMNIYVRETFRNRGLAHNIVKHLVEVAKCRGCGKIYLETTHDGKPIYTSLGFKDMPDMMKYYD